MIILYQITKEQMEFIKERSPETIIVTLNKQATKGKKKNRYVELGRKVERLLAQYKSTQKILETYGEVIQ